MNTSFIDACMRKEASHTPVWFMRQAGRYLPSYIKIKGRRSVKELAMDPESASEVVRQAAFYLGTDAAIIYSDIVFLLEALGLEFDFVENVGPVRKGKVRPSELVLNKHGIRDELSFVFEGIEKTVEKVSDKIPLIGFSGAPFTLITYMIEERPSRAVEKTRKFLFSDNGSFNKLMNSLSDIVIEYLNEQIKHGVNAIQLFDSWAGVLSEEEYNSYVLGYVKKIFSAIPAGIPKIYFCENTLHLLKQISLTGADVISIDWRYPINVAWEVTGDKKAIQGNMDPAIALSGWDEIMSEAGKIIRLASKHTGHIFSLGHGVMEGTDPRKLKKLVSFVHEVTRRKR